MIDVAPFAPFLAGAVVLAVLPARFSAWILIPVPILGAALLAGAEPGAVWRFTAMDMDLVPVRVDRLSLLFGYLFHLAALIANVYSLHVRDRAQQVASMAYAGSAIGAVFAGDLVTLFAFWELMAVTSVVLIWARRTQRAMNSGFRYLLIQVLAGVMLLTGAAIHQHQTGSIAFGHIGLTGPGAWLIFLAFGVKCAFPMLHNWLTDAYPEATPTGTVYLSAFTTKVAVYALARGFPGTELLVYVGAVMTCFPIFYAVIENDLRRVLAYSMINQIGFMVCGIGIGTELAVNGAVAHAFNDVIFKGLLMMSMGAVLHVTGRINGSDLGGLYRSMPVTATLCVIGAASISAFPLFSGFVSKSMVMTAALSEGHEIVWLWLLFASAGVFHHAGIKIPFFAFFAHDAGIRTTEAPRNMIVAMVIAAVLCVGIGSNPRLLYDLLPYETGYSAYDATHVIAQLQLLFFSALAFVWLKLTGLYPPELRSTNIDAEWLYRGLGARMVRRAAPVIARADSGFRARLAGAWEAAGSGLVAVYGDRAAAARSWRTESMVLWAVVAVGIGLLFLI